MCIVLLAGSRTRKVREPLIYGYFRPETLCQCSVRSARRHCTAAAALLERLQAVFGNADSVFKPTSRLLESVWFLLANIVPHLEAASKGKIILPAERGQIHTQQITKN
jgi:hypothetical protein